MNNRNMRFFLESFTEELREEFGNSPAWCVDLEDAITEKMYKAYKFGHQIGYSNATVPDMDAMWDEYCKTHPEAKDDK